MNAYVMVKKRILHCLALVVVVIIIFSFSKDTRQQQSDNVAFDIRSDGPSTNIKGAPKHDLQNKNTFRYEALSWLSSSHDNQIQPHHEQPQSKVRGEFPVFDKEDILARYPRLELDGDHRHDKWIVLTTVQAPTDDVKYLSMIEGWRVVVVGDTKTPTNWSWPNCHFIDVDFQEKMGLKLPRMLPYRSYSRKNLGYLYAIAHGAKVIYETDDDNRPFDKLSNFQYSDNVSGLMFAGSRLYNAYRYFGQSTIWQRGFPLTKIGEGSMNQYRLSSSWPTPMIQQGVVNGDPDVDAVFRLTRKFVDVKLDVTFDPAGPPVIVPPGVFSPTNTQNTLFRYQAFWGLFIPTTLNVRTCDIWRGYVAQRLLWEIGGFQAFYPPNAVQVRNNHDLLVDMSEENQMYFTTEALLDFLFKWTCPQDLRFFQCVYKLMIDMVDFQDLIFKEKDVIAIKIWIEDLIVLGYEEPRRVDSMLERGGSNREGNTGEGLEKFKSEILKKGSFVHYVPSEQMEPSISAQPKNFETPGWRFVEGISSHCSQVKTFPKEFASEIQKVHDAFHDVLLVVYVNHDHGNVNYANIVKILELYYRPVFPNMAFCGNNAEKFLKDVGSLNLGKKQTFIEVSGNSTADYTCVSKALQMNYNVEGYLMINDDVIIRLRSILDLEKNKIWVKSRDSDLFKDKSSIVEKNPRGLVSYEKAMSALESWPDLKLKSLRQNAKSASDFVFNNDKVKPRVPFADVSVFYIPRRLGDLVESYFSHFGNYNVGSQFAIPAVLNGIGDRANFYFLGNTRIFKLKAINSNDMSEFCDFVLNEIGDFVKKKMKFSD